MKTRGSWGVVAKFAGVTVLVSSLLLVGALRSGGKRAQQGGTGLSRVTTSAAANQPRAKSDPQLIEAYGKLPMSFEQNVGQTAQEVRFVSHGAGYGLFLTPQEAVISLQHSKRLDLSPLHRTAYFRALRKARQATKTTVLAMHLEGANPGAQVSGVDQLPGKVNYFIGKNPKYWHTDVPSYARVKYEGVYPGVDLVFYGNQRRLEYDFVVAPGADPKVIQLSLKGAQKLQVNSKGDLVLSVSGGQVALQRPMIYQNVGGVRHEVQGEYLLAANRRVSFAIGSYDRSASLIIDPVLNYSTYLGGSASPLDTGSAIAVDALGDAFVTGATFSTTFPSAPGGFGAGNAADGVAFVTEINPTGTALLYTTYLGGTGGDAGFGIALDNSGAGANPGGNVYVTGATFSTDFPTTAANALKPASAGASIGTSFISKINPTTSGIASLVYSSYLGGTDVAATNPDVGNAIAADAHGNAYVTGITGSSPGPADANFPITAANAFQTTLGTSDGNAFLTKIDTTQAGSASLIYSTYLGGSGIDATISNLFYGEQGFGIALGSANVVYVAGTTTSTDFPTTATAIQPNTAPPAAVAGGTVFVTKIDTTQSGVLAYSTYLGGDVADLATAITVKPSSTIAYVTGSTSSPAFPSAPVNPFQSANTNPPAAFVTLIDTSLPAATALKYSTFLGGLNTTGTAIAVDATGNAYVAGATQLAGFPVTPGAFQPTIAAGAQGEGFISKVNPGGNGNADLVYSSFFGGSGSADGFDGVFGIAVDSQNNAYIVGDTFSSAATFPVFPPAAFQTTLSGLSDAFIAKLTLIPTMSIVPAPGSTIDFGTVQIGTTSAAQTVTLTNNTNASIAFTSAALSGTNAADYAVTTAGCSPNIVVGTPCVVSITFTPTVVAPPSEVATLTITDGDSTSPQVFKLTGKGTNTAPDFTLTGPAGTPITKDGTTLNFPVTVTPVGGFNSAVTFTCTSAPTLMLGTCNAATVTPDGTNPINSTVTVTSTAFVIPPASPRIPPPSIRQVVPLVLALLLLFLLPTARRMRVRMAMGTAMILFLVLAGCSGTQKPHTAKGNYALTIKGVSGNLNHTVVVNITIN